MLKQCHQRREPMLCLLSATLRNCNAVFCRREAVRIATRSNSVRVPLPPAPLIATGNAPKRRGRATLLLQRLHSLLQSHPSTQIRKSGCQRQRLIDSGTMCTIKEPAYQRAALGCAPSLGLSLHSLLQLSPLTALVEPHPVTKDTTQSTLRLLS